MYEENTFELYAYLFLGWALSREYVPNMYIRRLRQEGERTSLSMCYTK